MGKATVEIPNKLFFKIGEVCEITDTQPYVLRFWESEFPQLSPRKNRSGQRVYQRKDIEMVVRIKKLLYEDEYTIAGARKKLEDEAAGRRGAPPPREASAARAEGPAVAEEEHPVDALAGRTSPHRPAPERSPAETAALAEREARLREALGRLKAELTGIIEALRRR